MIQRPLDNNIRQPRDWNGRQWWCYGPPQKWETETAQYHCNKLSTCKVKDFLCIPNNENNKVIVKASINEAKGGEYEY